MQMRRIYFFFCYNMCVFKYIIVIFYFMSASAIVVCLYAIHTILIIIFVIELRVL